MRALDARFLKAIGDPVRVELIKLLLLEGEADVGSLAERVAPDRSVVSRHLQVLADVGLVRMSKRGRHRYFSLQSRAFIESLETILRRTRELVALCCPSELPPDPS